MAHCRIYAPEWGAVIKWEALNAELIVLLDRTGRRNDREFAKVAGVNRSTITRMRKGTHVVKDIEKISRWLQACKSHDDVGTFLRAYDDSTAAQVPQNGRNAPKFHEVGNFLQPFLSQSVTTSFDNHASPTAEAGDGAGVSTGTAIGRAKDERSRHYDLIEFICFALLRAVNHPIAIRSMDETEEHESEGGRSDFAVDK